MADQQLTLRYRPRTFDEITGQRTVRAVLKQLVKTDQVPPAIVFSGDRGTGKTTTGRILAAALNCLSDDTKPCGVCALCVSIFNGSCSDVIEIDAASNGLVEDIRKLKEMTGYSLTDCEWQVILLDEAHSMSPGAFNALLKILEEPPPQTLFILLTTEPGKILETVMSRCMTFEFRRLTTEDIVKRLQIISDAEGLGAQMDLLAAIAERAEGGMRDAVKTLDQVSRVGIKNEDGLMKMLGEIDAGPAILLSLCDGMANPGTALDLVDDVMVQTGDARRLSTDLTKVLRDVLVIQCGGRSVYKTGQALKNRELLARLPTETVVQCFKVLWDLKTRVRSVEDPRASLEIAVVMLSQVLNPVTASKPPAEEKLSPDELEAMLR